MIKYYIKKSWAIILMFIGIGFFILGENFLTNHWFWERFTVATVLVTLGGYYCMIVEERMEKYGRC